MDTELEYFLKEGKYPVKELARLTGKSTSTIYKAVKDERVKEVEVEGRKLFFIPPGTNGDDAGGSSKGKSTLPPAGASAVAPAPPKAERRGRRATGAGHHLTALVKENIRRKSSHGYRSLQIIIDNPGILTEEFVAKGGRLNDLRWDIAHGNVRVED